MEAAVRRARPADAMGIAIVQVYTWKTTYTGRMPEEMIESRIRNLAENARRIEARIRTDGNFFVAEAQNAVVGFACYGPSRNAAYPQDGEVETLYVLQGMQGRGIGRALFRRCREELAGHGYGQVLVNCLAGNPALAFYQKMGGVPVGRRTDAVLGGTITEDILRFPPLAPAAPAAAPPQKTLYLIGGTMGVGKTAAGQALKRALDRSVFLDGDWCWDAHPFQVTEETKRMVMENIAALLNNFLRCSAYQAVIFCWVMHEQAILDELLSRLDTAGCRVVSVSLVCSEQALAARLQKDIGRGLRSPEALARSTARLPLYHALDTVKIDTTERSAAQTAEAIRRLGDPPAVLKTQP